MLTEAQAQLIWLVSTKGELVARGDRRVLTFSRASRLLGKSVQSLRATMRHLEVVHGFVCWVEKVERKMIVLELGQRAQELFEHAVRVIKGEELPAVGLTQRGTLDDAKVVRIRRMYWQDRLPLAEIARKEDVGTVMVSAIGRGTSYAGVSGGLPEGHRRGAPRPGFPGACRTTDDAVGEIRERFMFEWTRGNVDRPKTCGELTEELAADYGVTSVYVYYLVRGERRPHSPGPIWGLDYAVEASVRVSA